MRGWNLSSSFSTMMIILSVIITFSFYGGVLLSCCHFPKMDRLTFDFELIGDITVVKTSCLLSFEPKLLFTQLGHLICPLGVLVSGWETFACSKERLLPDARSFVICYLGGLLLGLPGLSNFHCLWGESLLCHMVWCVLPGWQSIQHLSPNVLVSFLDPGRSEEILTRSIGICWCFILFDMWHALILWRHHLGVQRLSIYDILVAIMVPSVFHSIVALIAKFCVWRVAASISESHDH